MAVHLAERRQPAVRLVEDAGPVPVVDLHAVVRHRLPRQHGLPHARVHVHVGHAGVLHERVDGGGARLEAAQHDLPVDHVGAQEAVRVVVRPVDQAVHLGVVEGRRRAHLRAGGRLLLGGRLLRLRGAAGERALASGHQLSVGVEGRGGAGDRPGAGTAGPGAGHVVRRSTAPSGTRSHDGRCVASYTTS